MPKVEPNPLVALNNAQNLPRLFPRASKDFIDLNTHSSPLATVMEHRDPNEPLEAKLVKKAHTGKFIVLVTSYRNRLLDEDNLCEKFHVDALRYAGILPSDAPDKARIFVTQKKVEKKNQQKTLIEIWQEEE